jgi:hypothetical protein
VPSDRERGGLVGVKKPLVEAAPVTDPAIERMVLPPEATGHAPQPVSLAEGQRSPLPFTLHQPPVEEPTKPATFHLPISLIQRLRATCRLKNTTMVDFVRRAVEEALEKQRPTEEEIRQLLGR